ncbi:MAG: peptidoglycan-binding protein [Clostridiales bacterium]|jgi:peptidoglycan hydrolase-like protein with peptidoglycan-binding domain|nr:peptidoglycan-binding protein [Clostridiales bacterium]
MGKGYFKALVTTAGEALPVPGARVSVYEGGGGGLLAELTADADGQTPLFETYAPDADNSRDSGSPGPYSANLDLEISAPGFQSVTIKNLSLFDGQTAELPVSMHPQGTFRTIDLHDISLCINYLNSALPRNQAGGEAPAGRVLKEVIIPTNITVHIGRPDASAPNVTVPFIDYIKNVASHEIYPTWPEAAIEANVYCQITFALNRVYTEWYRAAGKPFDITSYTGNDQCYVHGGQVFDNVARIVDRVWCKYVRRAGHKEPYFTQFCNGTTAKCPGLSQWGTVDLANSGYSALQILKHYYPADIELASDAKTSAITPSYPGYVMQQGMSNQDIATIQKQLNRISTNFPLIPKIPNPNGYFGPDTTAAVRTFQEIAGGLSIDGMVGKATWNKISQRYTAVKRLAELDSEGEHIGIGASPPTTTVSQGNKGEYVVELQFLLNYLAQHYKEIPPVIESGTFDAGTTASVKEFQKLSRLTADGKVGPATWSALYDAYKNVSGGGGGTGGGGSGEAYPGSSLKVDSKGDAVLLMQKYLNSVANKYPSIKKIGEDGSFGNATKEAVLAFQQLFGLKEDGEIGPSTWAAIVDAYHGKGAPAPKYPGYVLKAGSYGQSVRIIQERLNALNSPSIPRVDVDGIYGGGTKAAVEAFQRLYGLTADGEAGPLTWAALVSSYGRAAAAGYSAFAASPSSGRERAFETAFSRSGDGEGKTRPIGFQLEQSAGEFQQEGQHGRPAGKRSLQEGQHGRPAGKQSLQERGQAQAQKNAAERMVIARLLLGR